MPSPAPSRRAVLTGSTAIGAVLLATTVAGCGLGSDDDATSAASVDPTSPAVDADSDLVERVGRQLASALSLAVATGASVPALRSLARGFDSLHRAHLRELSQPDDARDGKVGGGEAAARARLLRSEEKLERQLVQAALAAESGALAQVFASMAAAVAQRRAVAS